MNINDIRTLKNDITLVDNYFPKYIRKNNRVITGTLKPSYDILKYSIVDPSRVFTKSNVNYLDQVSFEVYENYLHTRNLYLINSAILDPIDTSRFKSYALISPDKLLNAINNGLLLRPKLVNRAIDQVSIDYIYESINPVVLDNNSLFKMNSIEVIVSNITKKIQDLYTENIPMSTKTNYIYTVLLQVMHQN